MYFALVVALAFMSWVTGISAQATHGFVELGFYAFFISALAVMIVVWFCETIGIWGSDLVTIRERN